MELSQCGRSGRRHQALATQPRPSLSGASTVHASSVDLHRAVAAGEHWSMSDLVLEHGHASQRITALLCAFT